MIYICIALILLICHLISRYKKIKYLDSIMFFLISILIIIMAATRENIGLDFVSYQEKFEMTKALLRQYSYDKIFNIDYSINDMEFLYRFLNIIVPNFKLLIFIIALMGVGIKCLCIGKYCENKFLCLFFYFTEFLLYYDMGVMRQGVALSFMLLGLYCIERKKIGLFWINILIGSLFHITAILMVPLFFVVNKKVKINQMILSICLISSLVIFDFRKIILFVLSLFCKTNILLKFEFYFNGEKNIPYGTLIEAIVIFLMFVFIIKKEKIYDETISLYLKSNWLGIIIMFLVSSNSFFVVRGTAFFSFVRILIIDQILKRNHKTKYALLVLVFFAILYFRTLLQIMPGSPGNNYQSYIPYNSYLF